MDTFRASTLSEDLSTPAQEGVIPLSVPYLAGNEWAYLKECLDTGWVSSVGPFVDRFERAIAERIGSAHAVAVMNGTAALHIALLAAGVRRDEEVLIPPLTFIAPVNAVRYCQAHPVFIDVDPETWQIDPIKVSQFLAEECDVVADRCVNRRTGRTVRAILPVHLLGLAADIQTIVQTAARVGARVIEDASEAMGVTARGRHAGTVGDIGCFSFNGNKIITTGGGGMVVTEKADVARYVRYLSTQARDDALEYVHEEVGYNYRLTNLQAALGVAQLEQLPGFVARKREIARVYDEAFRGMPLTLMPKLDGVEPTYWLYTVLLEDGVTQTQRKAFIRALHARGIEARPLWHTIHDLLPYQDCQRYRIEHAPRLYNRAVSLPSSVGLSEADQQRTIVAVLELLRDRRTWADGDTA